MCTLKYQILYNVIMFLIIHLKKKEHLGWGLTSLQTRKD